MIVSKRVGVGVLDYDFGAGKYLQIGDDKAEFVNDDALATKVEFPFPGDYTNTTAVLIALSHCNEHLGQLIAYSRMNGITPPWSKH